MVNSSWIAKITYNGNIVCTQLFDNEYTAVAFAQRIAVSLKNRCEMKQSYHTIRIEENSSQTYPTQFPLNTRTRTIVIVETDFTDLK